MYIIIGSKSPEIVGRCQKGHYRDGQLQKGGAKNIILIVSWLVLRIPWIMN